MQEFTVDGDPLIGSLVGGRYRVVRKLREGGMGVVYQARHEIIEKLFALKVLSNDAGLFRHRAARGARSQRRDVIVNVNVNVDVGVRAR